MAFGVLSLVVLFLALPAHGEEGPQDGPASPYVDTESLTGWALIEALDLQPIEADAHAPLQPSTVCEPVAGAVLVEVGDVLYCTAGITRDSFEGWELGERIRGRVPTEDEKQRMLAALMDG